MRRSAAWVSLVAFGCAVGQSDVRSRDGAAADVRVIGAWDARLSLEHAYPLAPTPPADRSICGTMDFVESHRASTLTPGRVAALGVYDLDLSRLGLDWLGDISFPTAVADVIAEAGAPQHQRMGDTITIALNPGSQERIVLRGQSNPAGVDGDWIAQSLRGTATGVFSLRPHEGSHGRC
jgi:hypothetical protein